MDKMIEGTEVVENEEERHGQDSRRQKVESVENDEESLRETQIRWWKVEGVENEEERYKYMIEVEITRKRDTDR